jgi:hypothetical protein
MIARKRLPRILNLYLKDAPSGIFESCDSAGIGELFLGMEERAPVTKVWVRNFQRLHDGLWSGTNPKSREMRKTSNP